MFQLSGFYCNPFPLLLNSPLILKTHCPESTPKLASPLKVNLNLGGRFRVKGSGFRGDSTAELAVSTTTTTTTITTTITTH